jgi:hypothetical protein
VCLWDAQSKLSAGDIDRPVGIARLGEAIDSVHGANVRLRWVTIKKHLCIDGDTEREKAFVRQCGEKRIQEDCETM